MSTPVAILGATGTVGQKAIALIDAHPDFHVAEVMASERSLGKKYGEACQWREALPMPTGISQLELKDYTEITSPFAISALPAENALIVEKELAKTGIIVSSNASAYRMGKNIPLLIPEVNQNHLSLIKEQDTQGKIITNPNCSTVFLAMGLAPLVKLGVIKHVSVVTLQALSGAGYPGVASMDLLGNIIPNIGGEEQKISQEIVKILGQAHESATFETTVHVHRVPVVHGHTIAAHVFFEDKVAIKDVLTAFNEAARKNANAYKIYDDEFSPQPARDLSHNDMRTHIGRIKQGGSPNVIGLVALGHNLVRGAAGAAIRNLEAAISYMKANP